MVFLSETHIFKLPEDAGLWDLDKKRIIPLTEDSYIYYNEDTATLKFKIYFGRDGNQVIVGDIMLLQRGELITIEQIIDNKIILESGIVLSEQSYNKLVSYVLDVMKPLILDDQNVGSNLVLKATQILKDNTDLFSTFFEKYSKPFYSDFSLTLKMESYFWIKYCLYSTQPGIRFTLLCDDLIRLRAQTRIVNNGELNITVNDADNKLANYFNKFEGLTAIIKDKYSLNQNESPFIVYCALGLISQLILSYYWQQEFSSYFQNINDMSLEECISKYLEAPDINCNSPEIRAQFTCFLMTKKKLQGRTYSDNYIYVLITQEKLKQESDFENQKNQLEKILTTPVDEAPTSSSLSGTEAKISINDVDMMTGSEFERFIESFFSRLGYETYVTKGSGDQGIDVIIQKNGIKIGIQTKCYSGSVGNKAVQEAIAGRGFYQLDKVMVITNSLFTSSAIYLARMNDVILWDRIILKDKLE